MPSASSRQRYRQFVEDYKYGKLDDSQPKTGSDSSPGEKPSSRTGRYSHVRDYVRWLWPHRVGVAIFSFLALIAAGLQMIDPLFMRYIIDKVLLNPSLDRAGRLSRLTLQADSF